MHGNFAVAAVVAGVLLSSAAAADGQLERGRYLGTIMDCTGCHTPMTPQGPDMSRAYSGGLGFEMPGLGVFFAPNITSDVETGLGGWTDEEIRAAVTEGVRPDGRVLAPIMPYHSYSALTPEDAAALVVWLRSLEPIENEMPGPFGEGEAVPIPYLGFVLPE